MKNILPIALLATVALSALAQQPAAPRVIAPVADPQAKATSDAKPEPIKPAPITEPSKAKAQQPTTIDCDLADMDLKNSVFTYTNNVVVDGPQFHLTTDGVFTVYMKKPKKPATTDTVKGDPKAAPVPAPVTPDAAAAQISQAPGEENSLDHATAVGKEVVIVKTDAEGKAKIGKCRNAYYDGKTGDMTLRDWPQVQDGNNLIIATEASTVMILTKDGKFSVKGRTRTELANSGDSSKKGKSKGNSSAAPSAGGGISIPTPAARRQQ